MTTIPASSLLRGDRVVRCDEQDLVGWVATEARPAGMWVSPGADEWDAVVLLNLEREGLPKWVAPDKSRATCLTRTAYLKADTMLDVERSSE